MVTLHLLGGFLLLFLGGEALVSGSVALARRLRVTSFLIGLTVVAYGTSVPELVISLRAGMGGAPDLAVGNVVGSNIANILLVLGAAAVIGEVHSDRRLLRRDLPAVVLTGALFVIFARQGTLERWYGAVMIALLAGLTVYAYFAERRHHSITAQLYGKEGEEIERLPRSLPLTIVLIAGGLVAVAFGAEFLIQGSVALARRAGISEAAIGLTLLAVGSSLPELATTIVAAYRRHGEVALGNVLGSSIFNILGIMGIVSLVTPLDVAPEILRFDIWIMLGVMALPLLMTATKLPMKRAAGILFLGGYAAYVGAQYL